MRYLAIARFRTLTALRTGTPTFVVALLPAIIAAIPLSTPEPEFRGSADAMLRINASFAVMGWFFHTAFLAFATLMSGKVKTSHDFVSVEDHPDLMDTVPVGHGARFWGEALGTFAAGGLLHLCCLPLLTAVAVLSPLPMIMFAGMEGALIALLFLASAGAAWQRRSPRTKYSATRGPRNILAVAMLIGGVVIVTTRARDFRDALLHFINPRTSIQAWREIVATIDSPLLFTVLMAMIYSGTIAYYYLSATKRTTREN